MFRPMRRKQKQITEGETKQLLRTERRGVLAVNGDDGYPYAIPVNYIYDEEWEKIYFHGAKAGHKVDALKKNDKVCFTVYGNERLEEGDWAPYLQSAVIFGRCHLPEDADLMPKYVRSRENITRMKKKFRKRWKNLERQYSYMRSR